MPHAALAHRDTTRLVLGPHLLERGSRELGLIKKWPIESGDVSLIIKFPVNT